MSTSYTAKDITVLEGLEPVRKRPGMYIGGVGASGLHHLVWEIVDNSIDEAMNGHATQIGVTCTPTGVRSPSSTMVAASRWTCTPRPRKTALELIFTVLHAGGKFEQGNYKTSGGLHGVGASVVNALSKELVATVKRDGFQWEQRFRQGVPQGPPRKIGPARGSGTTVFFHPDATIFPKIEFDAETIAQRLEVASYLHRGLRITFDNEVTKQKVTYAHAEGLADYLQEAGRPSALPGRCTTRRSSSRAKARSVSIWRCSGPSRPTNTCAATSTASPRAPAARTRTASVPVSARRCATSSRRTTSRRAA